MHTCPLVFLLYVLVCSGLTVIGNKAWLLCVLNFVWRSHDMTFVHFSTIPENTISGSVCACAGIWSCLRLIKYACAVEFWSSPMTESKLMSLPPGSKLIHSWGLTQVSSDSPGDEIVGWTFVYPKRSFCNFVILFIQNYTCGSVNLGHVEETTAYNPSLPVIPIPW